MRFRVTWVDEVAKRRGPLSCRPFMRAAEIAARGVTVLLLRVRYCFEYETGLCCGHACS
jgi:hypothetical protein